MAGRAFDPRSHEDRAGELTNTRILLRYALVAGTAAAVLFGLLGYSLAAGATAITGLGQWASGGIGPGTFAGAGVGFAAGALVGALNALYRLPRKKGG